MQTQFCYFFSLRILLIIYLLFHEQNFAKNTNYIIFRNEIYHIEKIDQNAKFMSNL